jgi:hypothetical protein
MNYNYCTTNINVSPFSTKCLFFNYISTIVAVEWAVLVLLLRGGGGSVIQIQAWRSAFLIKVFRDFSHPCRKMLI